MVGDDGEIRGNETYLNTQADVSGNPNTSEELEFFVPINDAPDRQEAAHLDDADLTVPLGSTGQEWVYHSFSRDAVFNGLALGLTQPLVFQIDEEDAIVITATSLSAGTSEFSTRAEPTLPGDFDLGGSVDGGDFLTWQRNVGKSNPNYWDGDGDADFDGDVDGYDLDIWQANFGQTP